MGPPAESLIYDDFRDLILEDCPRRSAYALDTPEPQPRGDACPFSPGNLPAPHASADVATGAGTLPSNSGDRGNSYRTERTNPRIPCTEWPTRELPSPPGGLRVLLDDSTDVCDDYCSVHARVTVTGVREVTAPEPTSNTPPTRRTF